MSNRISKKDLVIGVRYFMDASEGEHGVYRGVEDGSIIFSEPAGEFYIFSYLHYDHGVYGDCLLFEDEDVDFFFIY